MIQRASAAIRRLIDPCHQAETDAAGAGRFGEKRNRALDASHQGRRADQLDAGMRSPDKGRRRPPFFFEESRAVEHRSGIASSTQAKQTLGFVYPLESDELSARPCASITT
jgi:hypothetical protein